MVHEHGVAGPSRGDDRLTEGHRLQQAETETFRAMERNKDVACGIESQHVGVAKICLHHVNSSAPGARLTYLFMERCRSLVQPCAIDLHHKMGAMIIIEGTAERFYGRKRVLAKGVARGFDDADENDSVRRQHESSPSRIDLC